MSNGTLVFVQALNVSVPVSNISTTLLFVSPHQANNMNDAAYLHIASTGVLIWDVLNNLRNDFKIVTSNKMGIPTVLYFVIRLTLLTYALGRAILLTAAVDNCSLLGDILNVFLIISVAATTTFFYLRVVAVYSKNPYTTGFFGLTWLSTVAMVVTFFKTFGAMQTDPYTNHCYEIIKGNFLIPTLAVLLINDVLIYVAIAYRIYRIFLDYEFEADLKRKLVILLFGASLPVGSKIVLLESQLYCLIILFSKAFLVIMVSTDPDRNSMFIICHLVLVVVLSSRVYRELREIGSNSQRRTVTDFNTGNITSAEFAAGREIQSTQERISRKTAELEDDISSIGGTTTRTTSFLGSIPTYLSDERRSDDYNMRTLRSGEGETSQQSSFSRPYDRSDTIDRV